MRLGNVLLVAGSANFSTRDVWDGYRIALQEQGWNVIPYSTFSFLKLLSVDAVCNDIIGTAVDVANQIDYVIFVDGLYFRGTRARVPLSIRRAGIKTVLIATDDPYAPIGQADSLYMIRFSNEVQSAGDGVVYLPTATLIPPEIPPKDDHKYAVSFLGTVFEDRVPTLLRVAQYCETHQLRFLIAGKLIGDTTIFDSFQFTEVRLGTIDEPQKWAIYSDSCVTLNVFRQSDSRADSPNPRIFEVTAFGHAALISGPRRSEVDNIYGDSIHHFDEIDSIDAVLDVAIHDLDREQRVAKARQITLQSHTYHHRAAELTANLKQTVHAPNNTARIERQTSWIIGCGRTGSTWLAEMLGDFPKIRRWHEPYFGRLFKHIADRPEELERAPSFFNHYHQHAWLGGIRDLFFQVAKDRFPQLGQHALMVKEVNTAELYPWLRQLFPTSPIILLIRDPMDVLDSYLDLQLPGSWNDRFASSEMERLQPENIRRTADHISRCLTAALAVHDQTPPQQRVLLTYESILQSPDSAIQQCADLVGVTLDAERVAAVVQKHAFANYKQTGRRAFRRQGKAGVWSDSPNFTTEVRSIADEVLGSVRQRLGYQ